MSERKYVAYYRVSTERQGRSGLGLDAQRLAVEGYLTGSKVTRLAEFVEVESGKRSDRPRLQEALELCRRERAVLVIAKLDRLARNVAFIANLMDSGVEFVAVDYPQANRLTIHIMAAVAEHEREAISKRTKEALGAAKARGTRLGNPRPRASLARGTATRQARADAFVTAIRPHIDTVKAAGARSLPEIAAALNSLGVRTARGGQWHPASVWAVLNRGGAA